MKLVTVSQMRAIEKEADAKGLSYAQMMENAGRGLAEYLHNLGENNGWETVTGIVGSGNNGGDTLVALAWLAEAGWRTHAYLVNRRTARDPLVTRYLKSGGDLTQFSTDTNFESLRDFLEDSDLLLDGLLGTGIKLPLRDEATLVLLATALILSSLDSPVFVAAVDCPSGVDCDTGARADETLRADLTLTMAAVKQGLLKLPAFDHVGDLELIEIGLPPQLDSWNALKIDVPDAEMISPLLPERNSASHKGTFGTAFVAAGSTSYTGAALLAGKAAYRIGAGLVTMAVPEPLHAALAGHLPEATWVLLQHEHGFVSEQACHHAATSLERATAILIGPGFGNKHTTKLFVEQLIPKLDLPAVFDADGLRHLAGIHEWRKKIKQTAVLTPHPGEMSAMTGLSREEIQSNRIDIAAKYAKEWGHVVVLKGAFTVIASPDGRIAVIPVATPALARAGTGDVLAGLIVGLRAQGLDAYDSAVAGAFIHAEAGLLAADLIGTTASVLASDVLDAVSEVLSELSGF
ncbi:MAG: NAD(P)H-hydrate dehydratase [Anaerolineales bacterium]|jgi:NAD(P)H-hydrate epimerase|nr:NAD(P)H-hydrate dehydratase [Anaerolineales bacterium]